jgi:hypothetical protein
LRWDAKGISNAIEEREERSDVDRLGNLILAPSCIAQFLDVFVSRPVCGSSDEFDVIHERTLGCSQAGFIELAFENCCNTFVIGSLNTQEEGMAVQSIWAAVQVGDIAGDHLLVAA